MNVKQLKKFIAEQVRKEIRDQKEELIKEIRTEVKAELFDLLVSPSNNDPPLNNNTVPTVNESTEKEIDRTSLRQLFESRMAEATEGDTIMATTKDVGPSKTPLQSDQLPETFVGVDVEGNSPQPEAVQRTLKAINRDYSALMKAMEEK